MLKNTGSPLNTPLNYPIGVSRQVMIAQYLACLVSVFTATDFVDGILYFRKQIICEEDDDDYTNSNSNNVGADHYKKSRMKWEVSNLMRMAEGAFVRQHECRRPMCHIAHETNTRKSKRHIVQFAHKCHRSKIEEKIEDRTALNNEDKADTDNKRPLGHAHQIRYFPLHA